MIHLRIDGQRSYIDHGHWGSGAADADACSLLAELLAQVQRFKQAADQSLARVREAPEPHVAENGVDRCHLPESGRVGTERLGGYDAILLAIGAGAVVLCVGFWTAAAMSAPVAERSPE
jgi:hypothetical protein